MGESLRPDPLRGADLYTFLQQHKSDARDLDRLVTAHFRRQIVARVVAVDVSYPLRRVLDSVCEDVLHSLEAKAGGVRPEPRIELAHFDDSVTADVPSSLLHYSLTELAKNCFARPDAYLSLEACTENAILLRFRNRGHFDAPSMAWFATTTPESIGYAYGGFHGPQTEGLGVGFNVAKCALKSFGAGLVVSQAEAFVNVDIVIERRGIRRII